MIYEINVKNSIGNELIALVHQQELLDAIDRMAAHPTKDMIIADISKNFHYVVETRNIDAYLQELPQAPAQEEPTIESEPNSDEPADEDTIS